MKYTKSILSIILVAFIGFATACGGGGGGGGGGGSSSSSSGNNAGGGGAGFTEPTAVELDGKTLTFNISNGTTIQVVYDHFGGFTVDIITGDDLDVGYSTLGMKKFGINNIPPASPLIQYEFDSVQWTSATEATLGGTYDSDFADNLNPLVPVTATLVVTN